MSTETEQNNDRTLTPEQVKNWRRVLLGVIGPYALLMSDEEVQQVRDKMQELLDAPENNAPTHE